MRVERVEQVIAELVRRREQSKHENDVSVIVGYTANYALHVHEMVDEQGEPREGEGIPRKAPHKGHYWDPQGQAQSKFLEQPYRENYDLLYDTAVQETKRTRSLQLGLKAAGLDLMALSLELVPVDIGDLHASAFTRVERY